MNILLIVVVALIFLGIILGVASLFFKRILSPDSADGDLPFRLKKYFFTRSEQEFFKILESQIDRSRYTIFPKVRLSDLVETVTTGHNRLSSWNKIRSKHIDFLIWDSSKSLVVVAIELDGSSHGGGKMQKSDDFKNMLYPSIGLKLARVRVGSDYATEISRILGQLESDTRAN